LLSHQGHRAGGRRDLSAHPGALAGVNVGGTTTSVVLGDPGGAILARRAWPTQTDDGEALFAAITVALAEVAPQASAIGVAIGGPMDARTGTVISPPHLPGMHGFPLGERLRAQVGLPVTVHHDAAACALAEVRWGADRGAKGLAYLTCGTGFGAGIVLDGRARYGSRGFSPEIGHVRYRDDGPDVFGKPGSFESYGAASALPKIARFLDPAFAPSTGAQVAERAAWGDPVARAAIEANAEAVGAACALLADLLVLDVVVLGSLATYLGEPWIERVRSTFAREALPHHAASCTLRAPSLPNLQDLSGLAAALNPV
jgi:glucokinase